MVLDGVRVVPDDLRQFLVLTAETVDKAFVSLPFLVSQLSSLHLIHLKSEQIQPSFLTPMAHYVNQQASFPENSQYISLQ